MKSSALRARPSPWLSSVMTGLVSRPRPSSSTRDAFRAIHEKLIDAIQAGRADEAYEQARRLRQVAA